MGALDAVRGLVRKTGFDVVHYAPEKVLTYLDENGRRAVKRSQPFTMTPLGRIVAMVEAVRHISRSGIDGALVECGVWRGGSMMAAAITLQDESDVGRDLFLFDTFEGMPAGTDADTQRSRTAADELARHDRVGEHGSTWLYAGIDEVRANMLSTGYPAERVHLVKGLVEDTIPDRAPDRIALLRLDTDFYESTKHELEHLIGRMSPHGVVIIDDYGTWHGSRKAVDEFLAATPVPILLNRIDGAARSFVVPSEIARREA